MSYALNNCFGSRFVESAGNSGSERSPRWSIMSDHSGATGACLLTPRTIRVCASIITIGKRLWSRLKDVKKRLENEGQTGG